MMSELDEEKLFYERFNALHEDPALLRVLEKFGIGIFRRSSVLEGFDNFMKSYGFRGKCVVEIGTCKALTAVILSRYFHEVITIDVVVDPQREQVLDLLEIKNVTLVTVKTNEEKYKYIADLSFDSAYVDGDHARDTDKDFAAVRRCGRVLFHEYWKSQASVWNLINKLREQSQVQTKGKFALWTA